MKIYLSASAKIYGNVAPVIKELETMGHEVIPPNGYGEDLDESAIRTGDNYQQWEEKILLNSIPDVGFADEIIGMNPIVLNGDLSAIQ
jgi:hypothetical protein